MKLFALAGIGVVAVVLFFAFDPSYQRMRQDQAFYAAQSQQIQLDQQRLQLEERRSVSGAYTLGAGSIPVLLVLLTLCGGALTADYYLHRRVPLVRPDARGLFPVGRDELLHSPALAAQLAQLHQEVQALRAVHQPGQVPLHLNYAPHVASSAGVVTAPLDAAAVVLPSVPSFAELLSSGRVGRGVPLLLGFSSAGAVTGSWRDLYSSAVGGVPGSGKTTTLRFLAAQSALHGARFVVIDPHMDAGDESLATTLAPLSSLFLTAPASSDEQIEASIRLLRSIVDARLAGGPDNSPLILAVDEFSRLMARSKAAPLLADVLEYIAQEGRKVGVFALLSGQVWLASRAGGSELRYSLASCYVHRMNRRQAGLLLPQGEGVKAERLPAGQAVLYRTSGEVEQVTIPLTTADDVEQVGRLFGKPDGSQVEVKAEAKNTASQSVILPSADAALAAGLFMTGTAPADIVFQMRGVKSSDGGRRYQAALTEVLTLVREGIAR